MPYQTRNASWKKKISSLTAVVLLLSITMIAPGFRSVADDLRPQTSITIDLGTSLTDVDLEVLGAAADDHLSGNATPGASALATGDLNKDGFDDLIIGAPDADFTPQGGSARLNAGAVYVIFGRPNFAQHTIIDTNTTALSQPDIRVFGAAANDNLGFAVAAGDVNGDNIDDLVIGAPGVDVGTAPNNRDNVGVVYIIFGATGLTARTLDLSTPNSSNVLVVGDKAGDRFGSALEVGDVNTGATAPDLLVGAPGSKGPDPVGAARNDGGAAYVLFGGQGLANAQTTTKTVDISQAATPAQVIIYGKTGSQLGSSVAIGDVNAGGARDLLVGAPRANRPLQAGEVTGTGAVFIIFGGDNLVPTAPATTKTFDINTTQQTVSIYGEDQDDHLGASVATGNVNLDSTTDILIGAPDADGPSNSRASAGEAYVIRGGAGLNPPQGSTNRSITIGLGTADLVIYGAAAGDKFGSDVDVGVINTQGNTDTIADILVGAPGALSNKGLVSVLFGGATLFITPARDLALLGDDIRITGEAAEDQLGWALTTGDYDDNSGGDFAFGAPFNDIPLGQGVFRQNAGKVYGIFASSQTIPPQNQNPVVAVTSPNTAVVVQGGTTFNITWTATDPNGDNTIQSFEIRLSTDGGTTFNNIIASSVAGTARTFAWNVPAGVNTTTARIRVIAFDNAGGQGQDDSDINFTITDAGVPVTVTFPNGGEQFVWGQNVNITWTVGAGFENQVKGFDVFLTTDNGTTFTNITPINPNQPALGPAVRTLSWPAASICTTNAKIAVRATSVSNATSTDLSNGPFTLAQQGPHVDPNEVYLNDEGAKLNIKIINGTEPRFTEGVRLEVSSDAAGTQFFEPSKLRVRSSGKKLQTKGTINGVLPGAFIPEGAIRVIRITNPTCGITILRVQRQGILLVPVAAEAAGEGTITPQSLTNWQ